MSVLKVVCTFARSPPSNLLVEANNHKLVMTLQRFSTKAITKNLTLISSEKKDVNVSNLKLSKPQDRPLVVMPSWLMAKQKHVKKYCKVYLEQGLDVLNISVTPWQLLWPTKGTQVVAGDILKFLDVNRSYSPLLLHGFSVGAYQWSEVLVRIAAEKERYQQIVDRIVGQIWDSSADVTEIPNGFPVAVFPNNAVMQSALRSYTIYHMKTFHKVATCHYIRASQMFHTNLVKSPALVFVSKTDPIGAMKSNLAVRESWERMGIPVYWKCFEDSPHVGHMHKYPKEYQEEIYNFLDKLGLLAAKNAEKMQAKL